MLMLRCDAYKITEEIEAVDKMPGIQDYVRLPKI